MFYRHYKGGLYYSLGLTTHLKDEGWVDKFFNATHTEEDHEISIYMMNGKFFVMSECDAGHMLYMDASGKMWFRPWEMFFGTVTVDGEEIPRFQLTLN